jgi:hypothetical protein
MTILVITKKSIADIAVILLLILLAGMQAVEVANANQSTKPSVPQFTIKFQNNSTIQLVIENQPFTNSSAVNSLLYQFRVKDHYSDKWVIAKSIDHLQSSSTYTELTIPLEHPLLPPPANYTMLDFQLQAITGFYSITYKPGYIPGAPTQAQSGDGYEEITFNPAESSDWSNTQTVNLNETSPSPSPTPKEVLPNSLVIAGSLIVIIIIVLAVAILFKKRLTSKQSFL